MLRGSRYVTPGRLRTQGYNIAFIVTPGRLRTQGYKMRLGFPQRANGLVVKTTGCGVL